MSIVKRLMGRLGLRPAHPDEAIPDDMSAGDRAIFQQVRPYTMTSARRVEATLASVRYVVERNLPGALVECGVWRGGSVMAMLLQLLELGVTDRDVYLYDTFEGMTAPTEEDVSDYSGSAMDAWKQALKKGERAWDGMFREEVFNEQDVRKVLLGTGYPVSRLHFIKGPVEETVPATLPEQIALLRLDTDWYASTRHELQHMYPVLSPGGVLIIDDYGHWQGARQAVDEYMAELGDQKLLLNRVDYTARLAVKPG